MSSFGETLRAAREAKGLTCSQVAAQTHMLVQIVEEMEREDFHRIPAPIYGRGFVRLFADCVGLDPVPLVREFMDIYQGRRTPMSSAAPSKPAPQPKPAPEPVPAPAPAPEPEPVPAPVPEPAPVAEPEPPPATSEPEPIPQTEAIPAPEPVPAPEPETVPATKPEPVPTPQPEPVPTPQPEPVPEPAPEPPPPPQVVRGLDLFEQSPTRPVTDDQPLFGTPATPAEKPVAGPAPQKEPPAFDIDASPYLTQHDFEEGGPSAAERFRKSISAVSSSVLQKVRSIPRRTWRIAALVLGAVLVLLFIIWCISKLYSATSTEDAPREAAPADSAVQPETPTQPETPPEPAATNAKPAPQPTKPSKLTSTGQNIPDLYIDD